MQCDYTSELDFLQTVPSTPAVCAEPMLLQLCYAVCALLCCVCCAVMIKCCCSCLDNNCYCCTLFLLHITASSLHTTPSFCAGELGPRSGASESPRDQIPFPANGGCERQQFDNCSRRRHHSPDSGNPSVAQSLNQQASHSAPHSASHSAAQRLTQHLTQLLSLTQPLSQLVEY